MNKRRKIYKGFNKRRKNNNQGLALCVILVLIATPLFIIKNKDKDEVLEDSEKEVSNIITYDDIKDTLEEQVEEEEIGKSEEVMVTSINEWTFYTIQVASMEDDIEVDKLTSELESKKIPYSILDIDGIKKVQTYSSFTKDGARNYLDNVRENYPDSFLAEVNMPMISLEYTQKYEYISQITNNFNDLIQNFEEETKFWDVGDINLENYNQILVNRRSIVDKMQLDIDKIDYEDMEVFKENLKKYITNVESNIEVSSKSINEQNENNSKGLLLNSMQGYSEFINSLK